MNKINLKKVLSLLLDNVDTIIAIIICIIAGIYGLIGINTVNTWILSAITWALGLIALGMIKDRKARDKLQMLVEDLKKPIKSSDVLKDRSSFPPFTEVAASAQEVWLFGASLVNLVGQNENHIKDIINNYGAKVKVLILDENSPSILSAAECLDTDQITIIKEIERVDTVISNISSKCRNPNGYIKLRKARAFPNYSLTIIDPSKPTGLILVEYNGYNYREQKSLRPHIELQKANDPVWFELYVEEFKVLWDESQICI